MPRKEQKIQPGPPDTSGVHLWLVLWRTYRALRRFAVQDIAARGLGLSDFAVLEVLLHKGPMPVNSIGPRVDLTSGSITVAVDRLAAKGLVSRESDPGDRRARVVHLTEAGRKLIECAFADHARSMERCAALLSPPERLTLLRLLRKMSAGIAT